MMSVIIDDPFPVDLIPCIERFFDNESTRKPGLDVYQDVFDTDVMFPLQRQRELGAMMREARSINPKIVMEIGADKGGGLYHWCKSLPTVEKVIACEIRGTPYSKIFEKYFPHIQFLWLPESSFDPRVVQRVREWLELDKIDCLFIDGDKSFFDRDFDCYRPLVKNSGIVFMHDIVDPAPKEAYDKICKRGYDHKIIHDIMDSMYAKNRADLGIKAKHPHEDWLRHWNGSSCGVGVIYMEPGLH